MKRITIIVTVIICLAGLSPAGAESAGLHGAWDQLLKNHVKNGHVDYKGFAADVEKLDNYLERLDKEDISVYNREQRLAFWINAYNAFTIKLIVNHYPVKSIRKIANPWGKRICKAAAQTLCLDDIEHKILRKKLAEPRIHFAVACASIGCPDLQNFAFLPGKLEDQLDLAARRFFASPKHFYIEEDNGTVFIHISMIFSWFGGDFGKTKKERAAFVQSYLDPSRAGKLKKAKSLEFKYIPYDWNLNERKSKR